MESPEFCTLPGCLQMIDKTSVTQGKILYGKRVFLRPMLLEDAEHVVRWRSDPEILGNIFAREPLTLESHLKWFQSPREGRLDYIICLKETEGPIGTVNFTNIDGQNLKAEAGKMLGDKSTWGKGLAREAFILCISFGFREMGLNRIYVRTLSTNQRNIELNKKLGFKIEGILREDYRHAGRFLDVVVMSILRSEANELGIYDF